jgi:GAF domain-containing protein
MRQRDKAAKTRRQKQSTPKTSQAPDPNHFSPASEEKNVARLSRELNEAFEQQAATADILNIISSSPTDTQPIFDAIVQSALKLFPDALISLALRYGDRINAAAVADRDPERVEAWRRSISRTPLSREYMHGAALLDCRVVDVPDVTNAPAEFAAGARNFLTSGNRAITITPMTRRNEAIGLLTVVRRTPGPLSDKQFSLLRTFAAQAVIAIENTRLLNELRESLQQQTATADVLKVISRSTFDLKTVLTSLVETAVRVCEADIGNIARPIDGDTYKIEANCGQSTALYEELARQTLKIGKGSVIGRTALNRAPVHILDAQTDPDYELRGAREIGDYHTMLGVPMVREGNIIGVFGLARNTVRAFTEKQIELVTTFADQAVIAIENVRLFESVEARTRDLSESLEQQTATSEVLKVISSSPGELEPVFQTILSNATRLCEAMFGTLYRYDGGAFYPVTFHQVPSSFANFLRQRGSFVPPVGTPLDRLLRTGKVIRTADDSTEETPSPSARIAGAKSHIAVPMFKDDQLTGAIVIYRTEIRPFTDKQIELVTNFAAQAVIAIENTRLLNELRESLQQQTATADVLKVISRSTGDLKPVFESILANATRICEAKFGALFLTEGDAFQAVALHGAPEYAEARRREPTIRPGPGTSLNRAASTKQPVQIADIRAEPAYTNDPQRFAILDLAGARTIIAVPMLKDDVLVGIINIYRTEVRPFIDKQIELLKNFAAQAVIAIENARLLNELRESLQQQTATADVLKVISRSTFDLKAVLTNLVETAVRVCEADIGNIARPIDGETYKIEANYGQSTALYEELARQTLKIGKGSVIGRTALSRAPVHILDAQTDPDYELRAAREIGDYHTMLGVPMVREGNIIGVFGLARNTVRAFTEKQIELVTTFADQAVIAIENVRLFESVEARTRELAQSLDNLRTTQDRLVQTEKLASLGQLTAGIAHEIKNPLNFVNNFSGVSAELIDELQNVLSGLTVDQQARSEINELTDTLRSNLDKVVQHGKRADAIVKNMLLHSREGSGEHRVVDINALVEESLNLAYHGARAEKQGFNITMERSLDPAAGEVDLFPQDITRVLLNLISNGFYAATKRKTQADHDGYEPTLAASTRSLGDQVEIRIRDNGTGIPPEVKEKMFNPFFTTKPAGEGTGLGLSISHDIIVKQHGGAIEVDTEPGEYTEFRIVLPRKSAIVGKIGGVR